MRHTIMLAVVTASFTLAGCGGGGGNSASMSATSATSAWGQARSIQLQVSPATYAAGSVQREAYDYLNAQRQLCGFGLLQQSTAVDVAAQSHADYLVLNHLQRTHFEDRTQFPMGFTGVTVQERMAAAGYNSVFPAEVIGGSSITYGTSYGQASVMDLFTGPYHGYAMLLGTVDAGFGFSQSGSDPNTNQLVINFGATAARPPQMLATDEIASYPCNGATGILSRSYAAEEPPPIAGRDIGADPIGHPIYLKVRDGNTLVLQTYDLQKSGSSIPLALQLLDKSSDRSDEFLDQSAAVLMPLSPLDKNANYIFKASGTNNGKPMNVTFSFSTGQY